MVSYEAAKHWVVSTSPTRDWGGSLDLLNLTLKTQIWRNVAGSLL